MIDAELVSKPEGCNNNNLMTPNLSRSTKNPSAIKSLIQFSETLDVKHKTVVHGLGAHKERLKVL